MKAEDSKPVAVEGRHRRHIGDLKFSAYTRKVIKAIQNHGMST